MKWISIKERPPNPNIKKERQVFILTIRKEIEKAFVAENHATGMISFFSDNKVWGIESVTHWMIMPKLPEGDSE